MLRPVRLFVDDEKLLQLSSGECVQGVKTPCAFNKTGFERTKSSKPHSGAK